MCIQYSTQRSYLQQTFFLVYDKTVDGFIHLRHGSKMCSRLGGSEGEGAMTASWWALWCLLSLCVSEEPYAERGLTGGRGGGNGEGSTPTAPGLARSLSLSLTLSTKQSWERHTQERGHMTHTRSRASSPLMATKPPPPHIHPGCHYSALLFRPTCLYFSLAISTDWRRMRGVLTDNTKDKVRLFWHRSLHHLPFRGESSWKPSSCIFRKQQNPVSCA